tara:strand:- start:761 stop:949 length:189 start_codon:yes stop_codon:yes gene_type:complete
MEGEKNGCISAYRVITGSGSHASTLVIEAYLDELGLSLLEVLIQFVAYNARLVARMLKAQQL